MVGMSSVQAKTRKNKVRKSVGFAGKSKARDIHIGSTVDENVIDEYNVPTKRNRGAYTMHNRRFNARDPQSSLVRLQRETETYGWKPELSYANTHTRTESVDNARRNLAYMKEEYGDDYVGAYDRREEATATWNKRILELKEKYERLMREKLNAYKHVYDITPHELNQRESYQLGQLEAALKKEIIRRKKFDEKVGMVRALTAERRKVIVPAWLNYEQHRHELLRTWGAERAAADTEYQRAINTGRVLWRMPRVRSTFTNKMREATHRRIMAQDMEPTVANINHAKFGGGGNKRQ